MRTLMTALAMTALLAAGCGDRAQEASDAAPALTGGGAPTESDPGLGAVETISAGDAGDVDVRIDGARLELVDVRESPGWSHAVNKIAHDEVELDFRHDSGRVLRLEVELEDGRLKVHTE